MGHAQVKVYAIDENSFQVWNEIEPGAPMFLIAKGPKDHSHYSAYGVIRTKFTVRPDSYNKNTPQRFLCFSGHVVYPLEKLGQANLVVEMKEVLHLMATLRRTLAQVDRSVRFYHGKVLRNLNPIWYFAFWKMYVYQLHVTCYQRMKTLYT